MKSSMRRDGPSTFSPDGVRHRDRRLTAARARRRAAAAAASAATARPRCSAAASGSRSRVAMPCRSPVAEWHVAHFAAKYALPALASPTTMLSSTGSAGGRRALAAHRRRNAVDVLGDRLDVVRRQRQRRHRAACPGSAGRSGRPAGSARRPGRSARAASAAGSARPCRRRGGRRRGRRGRSPRKSAAARDHRGIAGRALLRRERRAAAASAGRALAPAPEAPGRPVPGLRGGAGGACGGGPCAAIWTASDTSINADAAARLVLGFITHLEVARIREPVEEDIICVRAPEREGPEPPSALHRGSTLADLTEYPKSRARALMECSWRRRTTPRTTAR